MEGGGPDPASGAQVGERKRPLGFGERRRDALLSEGAWAATGLARSTASRARAVPFWTSSMTSGRCAMLDGQRQLLAVAPQIEVAVAPGVELGGAAQGLAGAEAGAALPGVVHDEHGDAVPALQLAQPGEQGGDLAAGVLVDAVQPHEGIEDEQTGPHPVDGLGEVAPVGLEVEAQRRRGDDLDIEIGEPRASPVRR